MGSLMKPGYKLALCCLMLFSSSVFSVTDSQLLSLKQDVASLEKQVLALQANKKQTNPKKSEAEETYPLPKSPGPIPFIFKHDAFSLAVSGQVNFMVLNIHDSARGKVFAASNSNSNSRLNINTVFAPRGRNSVVSGSNLELGFPLAPSETVTQDNDSTGSALDTRIMELYISHPDYGTLFLGKGWTASDNISEIDYSGTGVAGYSFVPDVGGGIRFRSSAGLLSTNPTVSDLYSNLDGFGRRVRLQYNSPSIHGFQLMTSFSGGARADFVVMYRNNYRGAKIGGAVAMTTATDYFSGSNQLKGDAVNGSVSVLLPAGANLTLAIGYLNSKTEGRANPRFFYGKIGRQGQWFKLGRTALSVDYGEYDYMYFNSSAKTYGLQFVQSINRVNSEFYAGYRHYNPDRDLKDSYLVFTGLRYFL